MYLIVGLGNPEEEYSGTRHNMGFDTINKICEKYNIKMSKLWRDSLKNKKEQVLTMQCLLYAKGYKGKDGKALVLDGDFGENTEYALKTFEKAKGLDKHGVSGVCERAKWAALLSEYKK